MSDFEKDLIRLCMTECARVQGDSHACAETAQAIATVLASAIAMMACGHEQSSAAVAGFVAHMLPITVAQRAASFRATFGASEPRGTVQ